MPAPPRPNLGRGVTVTREHRPDPEAMRKALRILLDAALATRPEREDPAEEKSAAQPGAA